MYKNFLPTSNHAISLERLGRAEQARLTSMTILVWCDSQKPAQATLGFPIGAGVKIESQNAVYHETNEILLIRKHIDCHNSLFINQLDQQASFKEEDSILQLLSVRLLSYKWL